MRDSQKINCYTITLKPSFDFATVRSQLQEAAKGLNGETPFPMVFDGEKKSLKILGTEETVMKIIMKNPGVNSMELRSESPSPKSMP